MSLVEKAIRKLQEHAPRATGVSTAPPEQLATAQLSPEPLAARVPRHQPTVAIHTETLRVAGLVPPVDEEREFAEQYRRIKRPLIANVLGHGVPKVTNGHLIVVTSAMSGEGKTFTSLNLALSLALEKDVHTLLVDADVAKPQISRLLGLSECPGLLDALRDPELDVEDLIHATNFENLEVLPAGKASSEATELLASQRMKAITEALADKNRQRIVLFDSPPLLQTSESHVLTQAVGQVLIVVRAEATSQPVLLDALKLLEGHGAVSLVLNQTRKSPATGYYYGYGDARPS